MPDGNLKSIIERKKVYTSIEDLRSANNYASAFKESKTAIEIFRDDRFLIQHAQILREQNSVKEAHDFLMKLDKKSSEIYIEIGKNYLCSSIPNLENSIRQFENAFRSRKNRIEELKSNQLIKLCKELKQTEQKISEICPHNTSSIDEMYNMYLFFTELRRYDGGIFRNLADLNLSKLASLMEYTSIIFEKDQKYKNEYNRLLKFLSKRFEFIFGKKKSPIIMDYVSAIQDCEDTLKVDKENIKALATKAYILREFGEGEKSKETLIDYLKNTTSLIDNKHFPLFFELAKTFISSTFEFGKIQDAINKSQSCFEKIYKQDENLKAKNETLRNMNSSLTELVSNYQIMRYFLENLRKNEDELILFQNACCRYKFTLQELGQYNLCTAKLLKPYCEKYSSVFDSMFKRIAIYPHKQSHDAMMGILSESSNKFDGKIKKSIRK